MEKSKKNKIKFIVVLTIFIVFQIGLIICDILWTNLDIIELNIGVSILLTANSVLFTIVVSYLLFLKELNKQINYDLSEEIYSLFGLIIMFVMGVVINIFFDKLFISEIFYIVISMIYIIYSVIKICVKMRCNEVITLINDIAFETGKFIENNSCKSKNKVKEYLEKLNKLYKFQYLNGNIEACLAIINVYSNFIKKDFEDYVKKIINENDSEKNILMQLIDFYEELIINDNNDFSITLNNTILKEISNFCIILVKCESSNLLELVLEEYNNIVINNSDFLNNDSAVYSTYRVLQEAYDLKNIILFTTINKKNLDLLKYFSIIKNDNSNDSQLIYKYLINVLSGMIKFYDDYFKNIFKDLELLVLSKILSQNINYLIGCFSSIINAPIYENKEVKNDFFEFIIKVIKQRKMLLNDIFISWIILYLEEGKIEEIEKKNFLRETVSYCLLELDLDIPEYLLPNYVDYSKENINNDETNDKNILYIERILNKCVGNKKRTTFINVLNNLNSIILNYDKKDKKEQKMWLKVYFRLFNDVLFVKNSTYLEIGILKFRKLVFVLDEKSKISNDLAQIIVMNIYNLAERYIINNDSVSSIFIELLKDFVDLKRNLNFVYTNAVIEEKIYENLFYIGVYAIEVGNEKILKEISNSLGWKIKEKIDKKHNIIACKIIDYASDLYKLSFQNNLSEQVIVFVGTLFIIIGAYSLTEEKYKSYGKRIINNVGKKEYENLLLKSKTLRRCKSKEWDNILKNKSEFYIDDFFNKLFHV